MNIFFDFDGTLADSSERMYRLFMDLLPQASFSKQEYWEMKRKGIGHEQIIKERFQEVCFTEFECTWMSRIEEKRYLRMDRKRKAADSVLKMLRKKHDLYLITARQHKKNLMEELEWMEIKDYFRDFLVTEGIFSKKELLERGKWIAQESVLISDGGTDIRTGHDLRYKTVGVTYGFLNRETMSRYSPDMYLDDLGALMQW